MLYLILLEKSSAMDYFKFLCEEFFRPFIPFSSCIPTPLEVLHVTFKR